MMTSMLRRQALSDDKRGLAHAEKRLSDALSEIEHLRRRLDKSQMYHDSRNSGYVVES